MPVNILYEKPDDEIEAAGSLLGAALRRETTVGSIAFSEPVERIDFMAPDETVEPVGEDYFATLETKYQPYAERFAGVTPDGAEALKRNIDNELEDQKTIDNAGFLSAFGATGAVQFIDPVNYIPFAGAGVRGAKISHRVYNAGKAALVGTAAQEAILYNTQETRTGAETALNIGASVVFGGALGAAAGFFSKQTHEAINSLDDGIVAPELNPTTANEPIGASVGAAYVEPLRAEEVAVDSRAQKAALDFIPGIVSPIVAMTKVRSVKAREAAFSLSENYIQSQAGRDGRIGPAVETEVRKTAGSFEIKKEKALQSAFKEFVEETGGPSIARPTARTKAQKEFGIRIGQALRNNDVDISGSASVTKAAQTIRREVLSPILQQAQAARLLPEGITVRTALSYFTRAWNKQALDANQSRFEEIVTKHFEGQMRANPELLAEFDEGIDFYASEAARGVWHTLTGRDGGFENATVSVVQGPLKGRSFLIPDAEVEEFLDNDAHDVLGRYIRTMVAEIELTKRFGSPDMSSVVGRGGSKERGSVQMEYDELVSGLPDGPEKQKLNAERDRAITTIEAMRDRLRGTYLATENSGNLAAISRSSNAFNYVRMLGDVTISSVPDPARLIQVHGLRNVLGREGIAAISESFKAMRGSAAENFLKEETELAGIAEVILNSRIQGMADIYDPHARSGPIESFTRGLANIGSMVSGINHWNQFWKQVAYQFGIQRFKRISEAGFDNASSADRKYLSTLKVGKSDFERIAVELQNHGQLHGKLTDPNTSNWADLHAVSIFRSALRADTDSVIVTPGIGDKPLFADHPLGAMAFQFKSFFVGSNNRGLVRGLGEDHSNFLQGSLVMVGMGAAAYYLKSLTGNFEVSDNPGVWLAEGLDRSGVLAIAMELNNTFEPGLNRIGAGGVYTGLSNTFGDSSELSSRYRFRRDFIGETLVGPTASTVKDGLRVFEDVASGDVKSGTVGSGARLLPFANHPGIKQFLKYYAVPELKENVQ